MNRFIPRGLAITYILFISIFAFDAITANIKETIIGLLIHLIPSFILIFILVLAWNKPIYASIAFGCLSLVFIIFFNLYTTLTGFSTIALPLIIIAGLFYLESR